MLQLYVGVGWISHHSVIVRRTSWFWFQNTCFGLQTFGLRWSNLPWKLTGFSRHKSSWKCLSLSLKTPDFDVCPLNDSVMWLQLQSHSYFSYLGESVLLWCSRNVFYGLQNINWLSISISGWTGPLKLLSSTLSLLKSKSNGLYSVLMFWLGSGT